MKHGLASLLLVSALAAALFWGSSLTGKTIPAFEHAVQVRRGPSIEAAPGAKGRRAWRFDFGGRWSLVKPGYQRVTPKLRYSKHRGYGWVGNARVFARDRRRGDAVDRDFNFARNAIFRVRLPNGLYDVAVRVGDIVEHRRSFVTVGEKLVGHVAVRRAGMFETFTATVRVHDAKLDVRIGEAGGPERHGLGDAIINGLLIRRRDLPEEPRRWEQHLPTIEFRRITDKESVANDWPVGSYLVHAPAGIYEDDRSSARLVVPYGDDGVLDLSLPLVGPEPELTIVELGFGVTSAEDFYSMLRYESPTPRRSAPSGLLITDPIRGGFWAVISAPQVGSVPASSYEVRNGESSWHLDPILLADGSTPDETQLYLASPGQSGTSAIMLPPSDNAFSFALVGEIKWCTANSTGWAASLAARALRVREGFFACPENFTIGGVCVNSTDLELIQRALFCNITTSEEVAESCAAGGDCPQNDFGHDYSYLGCGRDSECFMNRVADNLLQARDEGHFVPELHLAQVIHLSHPLLIIPGVPDNTVVSICGRAAFPGHITACDDDAEADWPGGVSVAGTASDCPFETSTHEFAHNFGAVHEATNESYSDGGCLGTVMSWNEDKCNVFSVDNADTLADCARADGSFLGYADDWCPPLAEVATSDCPLDSEGVLIPGL